MALTNQGINNMNEQQSKHLETLFEHGFLILIGAQGYLDGPVNALFLDEEVDSDTKGQYVYSSDVYDNRPLSEVMTYEVKVYKPALAEWAYNAESIDSEAITMHDDWCMMSPKDKEPMIIRSFMSTQTPEVRQGNFIESVIDTDITPDLIARLLQTHMVKTTKFDKEKLDVLVSFFVADGVHEILANWESTGEVDIESNPNMVLQDAFEDWGSNLSGLNEQIAQLFEDILNKSAL
jgi:hypothetical protein